MKKLLVTLALLTAGATFAAKDTDPFFGPVIPNNTLKAAIKQAVKEANAYTDKAVAGGTSGGVTTNDLNEVKADVAAAADKATAAKTSADAATTAVANLTTTVNGKLDTSVAEETYQPKGEYLVSEADPTVPAWSKAENKPTYNANEIQYGNGFVGDYLGELNSNKADKSVVPTKVSDLTNDVQYVKASEADAAYQPKGNYLTEHQDISGKANVEDVYSKTQADRLFITEHQDLSPYLKREDMYTKAELDGTFATIEENLATKAGKAYAYSKEESDAKYLTEHQDISGKLDAAVAAATYQPKGDYITEHQDLSGIIASINSVSKRLSLLEATVALLGDTGDAIEIEGDFNYNDPTKDIALAGTITAPSGASIKARKVSASGLNGTISPTGANGVALGIDATAVTLVNSELAGTTQVHHEFIKVTGAETMTVKGVTFKGDTYNTIMTGQSTQTFLKELNIEDCTFDENCKHVNVWFAGFQDNAVLNIKNCTFKTCEQFLCLSDFSGANANHLTVNIENVTIENYETGDEYEGIILCDDRVCTSEAQFREINPFSNITFNFKNVTAGGTKLSATTFGIGTGTTGQMMYLYSAKGGGVYKMNAGNATLFPTFNFVD